MIVLRQGRHLWRPSKRVAELVLMASGPAPMTRIPFRCVGNVLRSRGSIDGEVQITVSFAVSVSLLVFAQADYLLDHLVAEIPGRRLE